MSAIQALQRSTNPLHLPHDAASNAALVALYSAALGHGPKARYLRRFAQFDAAGRISPGWNGAASLYTLGWALLRRLWVPALLYVAVLEGLALLFLVSGRWLLHAQPDVQWPLLGALGILAWILPGMYGDALLHTEIRKRMVTALAQTQSVAEACTYLSHTASSRKRLRGLALAHVAAVLVGAPALYLGVWQPWNSVAPSNTATPSAAARPASTRTAQPKAPELTVGEALAEARRANAALIAPLPTPEPRLTPVLPATSALIPVQNTTASPAASAAESSPPVTAAPEPLTPSPSVAVAAAPSEPARTRTVSTNTTPAAPGTKSGYYLNAGLFAEEANARKVQAQLLNANLPAFRQRVDTAKGPRTRVRVGPFATLQQAQATHATLRSMGLEAVVFRQ